MRHVLGSAAVALGLVAGCGGGGDDERRPADLRVVLEYRSGSVPPPYHEEYRVEIGPGTHGRMALTPDYPEYRRVGVPVFRARFRISEEALDALWHRVRAAKLLESRGGAESKPGGGRADLTVVADGKRHAVVDREDEPLVSVVRPAVPTAVRASLERRRARYAQRRYGKRP